MKKTIKFNVQMSSKNHYDFSRHTQLREYFFDDKQVTELEFYGLEYLKEASRPELEIALKEIKKQEPACMQLFNDWTTKCSIIQELIFNY
jgi:hypothetical protein